MKRNNRDSLNGGISEESVFASDLDGEEADVEDTIKIEGSTKKKYKQKPRKAWCSDPHLKDWIIIDKDRVKCRFCNKLLNVKFSSLKSHSYSQRHLRAEKRYKESGYEIEKEDQFLSEYEDNVDEMSIADFENTEQLKVEKEEIQVHPVCLKSSPKKRKISEYDDKNGQDDFKAMKIALEKDKIKAIGDMSKQISSAIRYLADSIRLAIQSNITKSESI